MPNDPNALTNLTPQQRQFLNTYLSTHNAITANTKFGKAKDYNSRRGKVLAELAKLPDVPPVRDQLAQTLGVNPAPNQLSDFLLTADGHADQGDFKRAYKELDNVKNSTRAMAGAYDVGPALDDYENRVNLLVTAADTAVGKKQELDQWFQGLQPGLAQAAIPIDLNAVPAPNTFPTLEAWKLQAQQIADAKAQQIDQFEAAYEANRPNPYSLNQFLKTAQAQITALNQECGELMKGCRTPLHTNRALAAQNNLTNSVSQRVPLQPIKVNSAYPTALDTSRETRAKASLDPAKKSVVDLRQRISDELGQQQQGRDQQQGQPADREYSDQTRKELRRERRGDRTLDHDEAAVNPLVSATFDFQHLDGAQVAVLPDGQVDENSNQFLQIVANGKAQLVAYLQQQNVDPQGQQFFDLKLKTETELMVEYAKSVGWPPNQKQWSTGQAAAAKAVAKGWAQAIQQVSPATLDKQANQVTVGGTTFGNGQVIGKGGMGSVALYTDPNDDTNVVVVKSMLSKDKAAQEEMVMELKAHRRLMDGDPTDARRKNIVELHDVVKTEDGAMHMVMELVDGGDLEENRFAMAVASDTGLPEQARSILNQFMLKQALDGMAYMRDQNLVHFDLKPDNMFLTSDGTLKIADFGSAREMDAQGKVADTGNTTPGYTDFGHDTKTDMFALGRTLGVMEAKTAEASSRRNDDSAGELKGGAAGRLKGAMTDANRENRPTLEAAQESSYIKNLDEFPVEDLQHLSALSVEYGKELKQHFKTTAKAGLKLLLPEFAIAVQNAPDHDNFKEWMTELRKQIFDHREKLEKAKLQLDANPPESEQFKLQQQLEVDRARLVELEKGMVDLGDSPKLKELLQQIREVTDQLTHNAEAIGKDEEADLEQVVKQLDSASSSGAEFSNYVALKANVKALTLLGVDARDLATAATEAHAIVFTTAPDADPVADAQKLATTEQRFDQILAAIARNDVRAIVGRGLGMVLRDLAGEFQNNHNQAPPLTSEAASHAKLPKFEWEKGGATAWQKVKESAEGAGVEKDSLQPLDSLIKQANQKLAALNKNPGDADQRNAVRTIMENVAVEAMALSTNVNPPALKGFLETLAIDSRLFAELAKCNPKRLVWGRDPVQNWQAAAQEAMAAGEAFGSPDGLTKAIQAALKHQETWSKSDQKSRRVAGHAFDAYTKVLDSVEIIRGTAQTKGFKQYLADFTSKTESRRRAIQSQRDNPTLKD